MPKPTTTTKPKISKTQKLMNEVQALRKPFTEKGTTYDPQNTDAILKNMQDLHAQAVERSAHVEGRTILHSIAIIKRYSQIISYQES